MAGGGFTIGDWYWFPRQASPCRVIERQDVWGEVAYRVWLPAKDAVVRARSVDLASLESVRPSVEQILHTTAAAKLLDALEDNLLLAPIQSSVVPLPHQLYALNRAISRDRIRYLLADEVGLGKTIEAGLVLRELKLRGRVKRILVVAERDAGRLGLALYDRSRAPYRTIAALDDVALTLVDAPRDRVLFTRPTQAGLWQADMDLRHPTRIADRPAVNAGRRLLADTGGIWLAGSSEACGLEWDRVPLPAGRTPSCLLPKQAGVTGLSLDRVHRQLYFSSEEDGGADIGFAWYPPHAR